MNKKKDGVARTVKLSFLGTKKNAQNVVVLLGIVLLMRKNSVNQGA